jgi:hypothetical protein
VPHSRRVDDRHALPRHRYWLLLIPGVALVLAAVAFSAALLLFYQPGKRPVPREKFIASVVGLTPAEARRRVGEPDGTSGPAVRMIADDPSEGGLRYDHATYDPATGKVDRSAWLWMEGGRVSHVTIEP